MELGRLYGVGVGPGDPGLLTVRAREVLEAADVVAHFCKAGRRGIARGIVDAALGPSRREHAMPYPFTTEVPPRDSNYLPVMRAFYDSCAEQLAGLLGERLSIAVLCEGDPFFYGSYMHLHRRLAHRVPTEVVAGVTGMSACWTRAGTPMTSGDDVLTVVPGTLDQASITRHLRHADAAVVMKLGDNLPKVRAALAELGLTGRAVYVERGSMEGEVVVPVAELPGGAKAPYFAMIIVAGRERTS
ncbi:MAG: precorrin-2 C(20)-methyltransferase [Rhodospirillales bacterium]|nr:precorrin-2 C(20)-methyltransferase [Rhodospirillales bacterium]